MVTPACAAWRLAAYAGLRRCCDGIVAAEALKRNLGSTRDLASFRKNRGFGDVGHSAPAASVLAFQRSELLCPGDESAAGFRNNVVRGQRRQAVCFEAFGMVTAACRRSALRYRSPTFLTASLQLRPAIAPANAAV